MSANEERLYRRIRMTTAGVTITATNDEDAVHYVQGRIRGTPETIDNLQVVQLYGVASHAPVGSDAVVIFGGGDRSNGVIVGTANQKARPRNQQPGEVTVFTDEGDVIALRRGHVVIITTKTVRIEAESVEIAGKDGADAVVEVTGDINCSGTITAGAFVEGT